MAIVTPVVVIAAIEGISPGVAGVGYAACRVTEPVHAAASFAGLAALEAGAFDTKVDAIACHGSGTSPLLWRAPSSRCCGLREWGAQWTCPSRTCIRTFSPHGAQDSQRRKCCNRSGLPHFGSDCTGMCHRSALVPAPGCSRSVPHGRREASRRLDHGTRPRAMPPAGTLLLAPATEMASIEVGAVPRETPRRRSSAASQWVRVSRGSCRRERKGRFSVGVACQETLVALRPW